MAIKRVWIEPGCIAEGVCNEICPDVFGLDDFGESFIEDDADFDSNEKIIKEAAQNCPVKVIKFEEK